MSGVTCFPAVAKCYSARVYGLTTATSGKQSVLQARGHWMSTEPNKMAYRVGGMQGLLEQGSSGRRGQIGTRKKVGSVAPVSTEPFTGFIHLHRCVWTCTRNSAGAGLNRHTGMSGVYPGEREQMFPCHKEASGGSNSPTVCSRHHVSRKLC